MKDLCQKCKVKLIFRGAWNSLMAWPDWPWPQYFTTDVRRWVKRASAVTDLCYLWHRCTSEEEDRFPHAARLHADLVQQRELKLSRVKLVLSSNHSRLLITLSPCAAPFIEEQDWSPSVSWQDVVNKTRLKSGSLPSVLSQRFQLRLFFTKASFIVFAYFVLIRVFSRGVPVWFSVPVQATDWNDSSPEWVNDACWWGRWTLLHHSPNMQLIHLCIAMIILTNPSPCGLRGCRN